MTRKWMTPWTVFALLLACWSTNAQADESTAIGTSKKFGIGVGGGSFTYGLAPKLFISDVDAVQATIGNTSFGLNVGADYLRQFGTLWSGPDGRLWFGLGAGADIRPEGLQLGAGGASFRAAGISVETRLRGRFNVQNVLGAVAAGQLLGLDAAAIAAGVAALPGVPGRFEAVDEGQPFTVVVDYAHTPDGLANVLATARDLAGASGGRVTVVFGAGGDRDRGKRPQMGQIAAELADRVIVTSDNPRSEEPAAIVAEVAAGANRQVEVEIDRRSAIAHALEAAAAGDVIVIAGKGHEQGQDAHGIVVPFDDRAVARELLRAGGTE